MPYVGGFVSFVLLGFWLWAIFDVISSDQTAVRNLPKLVWLLLVVFLSTIGSLAWLLLGRPLRVPVVAEHRPVDADEERRRHYAAMDEELDRRLAERSRLEREGEEPAS
jgi:hypothetical protein